MQKPMQMAIKLDVCSYDKLQELVQFWQDVNPSA
jgi:hypothetical protein